MSETLTELCKRLEHFETPEWAVKAILRKEILTNVVVDPCVGAGILTMACGSYGYEVVPYDIHDWGYEGSAQWEVQIKNFLALEDSWFLPSACDGDFSVLMNPPFSNAVEFVEKSIELGARKIVCFQRFAWWESNKRKDFWRAHPPNRVYICGDRADCWRHDIPQEGRGSSSPTAHAWFVWEPAHPQGTILGHIYKGDAK
jgi:predicted RNA methylase